MSSYYTSREVQSEGDPYTSHWPVQNIIKKEIIFSPTLQRATVRTSPDLDRKSCLEPLSQSLVNLWTMEQVSEML